MVKAQRITAYIACGLAIAVAVFVLIYVGIVI